MLAARLGLLLMVVARPWGEGIAETEGWSPQRPGRRRRKKKKEEDSRRLEKTMDVVVKPCTGYCSSITTS
jgi:hypothetical protein